MGLPDDRQIRKEEEVDQRIDQLLGKGLRVLKLLGPLLLPGPLLLVGLVKEHLAGQDGLSGALAPCAPEEAVLPFRQRFPFVQIREDPREDADAVEGVAVRSDLGIGERGMVP